MTVSFIQLQWIHGGGFGEGSTSRLISEWTQLLVDKERITTVEAESRIRLCIQVSAMAEMANNGLESLHRIRICQKEMIVQRQLQPDQNDSYLGGTMEFFD